MSHSKKTSPVQRLGDVKIVREMLDVSSEHVRRFNDAGRMPKAIRLGRALRWDLQIIEQWIGDGCPDLSKQQDK